jgi:hypothetical protein
MLPDTRAFANIMSRSATSRGGSRSKAANLVCTGRGFSAALTSLGNLSHSVVSCRTEVSACSLEAGCLFELLETSRANVFRSSGLSLRHSDRCSINLQRLLLLCIPQCVHSRGSEFSTTLKCRRTSESAGRPDSARRIYFSFSHPVIHPKEPCPATGSRTEK